MMRKSVGRLNTLTKHLVSTGGQLEQLRNLTTDEQLSPSISVEPRIALYDEKVNIALRGFSSRQKVTVHGQVVHGEKKVLFGSCGQYVADDTGQVDLTTQPSHGGTYTGVEQMGIVWSLCPAPGQPKKTRMAINFTDRPGLITLNTYDGHLNMVDIYNETTRSRPHSLASVQMERWFRHKDVTRIEIEEGNIRGALFLPPGDGPFQGVIDMFGSSGGLIEYRAALLASRGFAALSLAFLRYKDLPPHMDDQNYDYFEEAVDWFSQHPKVIKGGVGVVAVSKGVEYGLCMGAYSPHVSAVVSINGYTNICASDLKYKGQVLLKCCSMNLDKVEYSEDEGLDWRHAMVHDGDFIPIWKGKAKHLMLVSLDDGQAGIDNFPALYQACSEEKKKDIEIVEYPRAGHLLEPPYNPLCRVSENKGIGIVSHWGGYPKEHAFAQEDSWRRILHFLRTNIPNIS